MFRRLMLAVLLIFVLVACNALSDDTATVQEIAVVDATDVPTIEASVAEPTLEATPIPTLEPTTMPVENAYNAPDWTALPLVNARTGASFTLADFAGKTVFVEPMATWCPNCQAQQGIVSQAMAALNNDDFVFISLSVGENVSDETLANYASRNNFPQLFAVASSDLTAALVEQFGFSVTTPPSTPHFTISPIGTVSGLSTGFHQSSAIIEEVTNAQNS